MKNMARAFNFLLGFVAGATSVLVFQAMQKRCEEESPDNLLESLGSKMRSLESRIAGMADAPTMGEIDAS